MKKICLLLILMLFASLVASCAEQAPEVSVQSTPTVSKDESSVDTSSDETESTSSEESTVPPLTMTQVSTVTDNFLNIDTFATFLQNAEKYALIPGLREGIVPQGIARHAQTGYVYISAYFKTENTPSVILVLDEKGNFVAEHHVYTADGEPFTGHMGGICVTEQYLYFSGPSKDGYYGIGEIPLSALAPAGAHDITFHSVVTLPIHSSYLFYDSGMLWVGTFYLKGSYDLGKYFNSLTSASGVTYGGYAAMLRVDENGKLTVPEGERYAVPEVILATPDKVQGFAYRDGKVALSISYGRNNNSKLDFYSVDLTSATQTIQADGKDYPLLILGIDKRTTAITAIGMSEGLTLTENGELFILFESGAQTYSNAKNPTDSIWRMPFAE